MTMIGLFCYHYKKSGNIYIVIFFKFYTMDGNVWSKYEGKKVFLRTNKDRVYSGVIKEVADVGNGIIFISLISSVTGKWTTIVSSEIIEIKEEN